MRGNKFFVLGILVLLGVISLSMNFVSAANAVTIDFPVASANVSGTYVISASLDTNTLNLSYAWFYYTYNNGTTITIASHSLNQSNAVFNTTWNSATAKDGANITFLVIVGNETNYGNGTIVGMANTTDYSTGVIVDNTASTIFLLDYVNATIKNNTNLTINISYTDINLTSKSACLVNVNGTNQTIASAVAAANGTYRTCNTTNLSLLGVNDGNQTIKIYINNSVGLYGELATYTVFIDGVAPSVELSATEITKNTITLAIGATDGTGTGVASCTVDRAGAVVSGTTSLTESGLSCATEYTYVVTCSDRNGHAGSATKTISTNGCGGGSAGSSTTTTKTATSSASEMSEGVATVLKYSDPSVGIKQISVEVNNPAQNVQITVTKEAGKPAAVSVAKTGKVYQYLNFETKNLADKLEKATVQFKVEKSWVAGNSVDKDKVVVSKFDETAKKWNELTTTYASEDTGYYYYDVDVTSFSYFAISEKSTVAGGEEGTATGGETGGSLLWLWVLIALVVLVAIGWGIGKRKK
jgi:PGF-pre-PGF domain-containing protein